MLKSLVRSAVAILTLLAGWDRVEAADQPVLRVMSWNVRYNNRGDGVNAWPRRKDWVAEIIQREKPDIVGLQEVLASQYDDLKARLPEWTFYGVGRDDGQRKGEFAPVLFRKDRFQTFGQGTFWLSPTPDKIGSVGWDAAITRVASWLGLEDRRSKRRFFIVNTHFDHRGATARTESAKLLVERLRGKFAQHEVVLTGDFNTLPDSSPYQVLTGKSKSSERGFRDALPISKKKAEGPDSTWNGFRRIAPGRRIDFVFVTAAARVSRHRILADQREGRFPSDHLPVLADLTWP